MLYGGQDVGVHGVVVFSILYLRQYQERFDLMFEAIMILYPRP